MAGVGGIDSHGPGFYRALIEHSRDLHAIADRDGRLLYVSPSVEASLGWTVDEMVGRLAFEFVHPEDIARTQQSLQSLNTDARANPRTEVRALTKTGDWVCLEAIARVGFESVDRARVHVVARDMSAENAVQNAMRNREQLFRTVANHPNIILWSIDRNGTVLVSEGEGLASLGFESGVLVGANVFDLYAERPDILSQVRRALEGHTIEYTTELFGPSGEMTVDTRLRPQFSPNGDVVGVTAITFDVTSRVKLEAELRRAKTLEAIGMLAGGVAHDFNNLLAAIIGFAKAAKNGAPDARDEYLDQVIGAGHRGAELIGQLLSFARKDEFRSEIVDIKALLTASMPTYRQVLGGAIAAVLHADAPLDANCHIEIDRSKLEQVLLNLVANARDAMPSGGTLSISLSAKHSEERGAFAELTVRDTGEGMDAATLTCVFDPFFSTKEQGSGLGLATTQSIVQRAGGSIHVESTVGSGTTFTLTFPIAVVELQEEPTTEVENGALGQGRILLIDDNQAVLESTALTLEFLGYEVRTATSGQEGYDLFVDDPDAFDLVMTDMTMPGMKGDELARMLRGKGAKVPILFVSGYHEHSKSIEGIEDVALLSKPYRDNSLNDAIAQLLAGRRR